MNEMFTCTAYHKAGYENAVRSLLWHSFYTSKEDYHWLGEGVYFWQRYEDAVWWPGGYVNPVILVADLECAKDRFLDLDDERVKKSFYDYIDSAFKKLKEEGFDVHVRDVEVVNGASCNYFKRKFGIELIRYSFPENSNRPQFCATDSFVAKNIRKASESIIPYIKENQDGYL